MTAETPGQALVPVESVYLYHWRFDRGEEFGLYRRKADAEAMAEARKAEHPGEGLFEVLGMALLDRPQPRADAATPGQRARDEDDREALATDAEDVDGALAAELRELADWYESSARHSRGIRANEQQLCANRIRAALVRVASGREKGSPTS